MDARPRRVFLAFPALLLALSGCAETDYASPCEGCGADGVALRGMWVAEGGSTMGLYRIAGETTEHVQSFQPDGAAECGSPTIHPTEERLAFSCREGVGRGSWRCDFEGECHRIATEPGALRMAGEHIAWLGRAGGATELRLYNLEGERLWQTSDAFAQSQLAWAWLDLDGARLVWVAKSRRHILSLDLSAAELSARTWLGTPEGHLSAPLLWGARVAYTYEDAEGMTSVHVARPIEARVQTPGEAIYTCTDPGRPVAAYARAGQTLLVGKTDSDGADLMLVPIEGGAPEAVGYALGRPIVVDAQQMGEEILLAWRTGERPRTHFESLRPGKLVLRRH